MSIWAIVPVKCFGVSKTRLKPALGGEQRAALAEAMLRDTLTVLTQVRELNGIAIVTRDPQAALIGRDHDVLVIEDKAKDLNAALNAGCEHVRSLNKQASMIILPTDLPRLTAKNVKQVLEAGIGEPEAVVLVPDGKKDGTNAMFLGPEADIGFGYGIGSFHRHVAWARAKGFVPEVLDIPNLAFDLDTPEDLVNLPGKEMGTELAHALAAGNAENEAALGGAS